MTTAWSSINDSRPFAHRPRHRRSAPSSSSIRFRPRFELVEDRTLLSTFSVTNTADSGPGSLRQAILDSDAASGGTNTIDFAIPGTGVRTIALTSPLPPIATPTLLDGSSQPGFAGTPLIALGGQAAGISDALTISSNLAVDSLAITSYQVVTTTGEQFVARVHAEGVTTRLLLMDAQGHVLTQSDGQSASDHDDLIELYVPAGSFSLVVQYLGGAGTYILTTMVTPAISPVQPIPVGASPEAIVAGDFNGDGHIDLAVANYSSKGVSILLGNGDGTFQPPVTYAVGTQPYGIVAGDFTGDGNIDLAVAGRGDLSVGGTDHGEVSVLLGNGDGTFQEQKTYQVGDSPDAIVAGDFTGNGRADLAVANFFDNTVSVLLGNGDGTFQPQVTYAVGNRPRGIVAGDFTGNGRTDLAVANSFDNTVSVLLGNGDGTFQPQVTYAVGNRPRGIVAGDFTGNGRTDLAVANSFDNTVSVLLGNGDGTFQPQVTYAVGSDPEAIVAGDFTGNGRTDLAVTNQGDSTVSVLLGNGDGTFQPQVTYRRGRNQMPSWRATSPAMATSIWPSQALPATLCRCCAFSWRISLGGGLIFVGGGLINPPPTLIFVGDFISVAQLVPHQESSLALVGTFLITTHPSSGTETLPSSGTEVNLGPAETEVATTMSLSTMSLSTIGPVAQARARPRRVEARIQEPAATRRPPSLNPQRPGRSHLPRPGRIASWEPMRHRAVRPRASGSFAARPRSSAGDETVPGTGGNSGASRGEPATTARTPGRRRSPAGSGRRSHRPPARRAADSDRTADRPNREWKGNRA